MREEESMTDQLGRSVRVGATLISVIGHGQSLTKGESNVRVHAMHYGDAAVWLWVFDPQWGEWRTIAWPYPAARNPGAAIRWLVREETESARELIEKLKIQQMNNEES